MIVANLQQHLEDLENFLRHAGAAAKVTDDLKAIRSAFGPFREHALKDFADFLLRAEAFSRGEVPVKPGRKSGKSTTAKPKPPELEVVAQEIRVLYDRVIDPSITHEEIETTADRLTAGIKKEGLVALAEAIGILGMKSKTNAEIIKKIKMQLISRKGATQRTSIIDKPEQAAGVADSPQVGSAS